MKDTEIISEAIKMEFRPGIDTLTVSILDSLPPNYIFCVGFGYIEHPWFNDAKTNIEEDGRSTKVKWVAVRGGIHDWAIYHSMDANICKEDYFDGIDHLQAPASIIAKHGAKLRDYKLIRKFIPCDEEALHLYRF